MSFAILLCSIFVISIFTFFYPRRHISVLHIFYKLYSTLKWTDWAVLDSANGLGISMRYRYNAFEVELQYYGNLQNKKISGGSDGYVFPALPDGLNPKYNIEHQIYACSGENKGNLTLQCFTTGNTKKFTITSHNNVTVTSEYVCGYIRYTRQ